MQEAGVGRGLEALWRAIALRQMTPKARSRAAGLVCTKCGSVALNKLLLHYIIAPLPPYFLLPSSSPSSMPRPPRYRRGLSHETSAGRRFLENMS